LAVKVGCENLKQRQISQIGALDVRARGVI
jgi:hypothetical protein